MGKLTKKAAEQAQKTAKNQNPTLNQFGFDDEEENLPDSQTSPDPRDETPLAPKVGRKRSFTQASENEKNDDFGAEMQKMLDSFGADVSKTLVSKRKRLEQYTQSTIKTSNRRIEDIWKVQQNERQKLNVEYCKQVVNVFNQWETDLEKVKDQEDKLTNLLRQQQKLFQQTRVVQSQRLKTIKQLHEQYTKSLEDLDQCHQDQQSSVQSELKKEMSLLQKRILMDTQQQEMANVRKSLQTMLF
ncbi:synaptonemal complex protein 3-like [Lineus longissimus]|uniref:synaptonemal complex protein 3-like n=1 Tax=Lineus longissimus TaxID=88925 RepID=UPI00315C7E46